MAGSDIKERASSDIEKAYWLLRQEILAGRLAPGEKLRIDYLKSTYGYGASGIREALSRLLSDGLVASEAQRGFWVAPVSVEDLRDLTATRKVIEVEALRQAILCGDVAWEARVVAAQYRLERFETSLVQETADSIIACNVYNYWCRSSICEEYDPGRLKVCKFPRSDHFGIDSRYQLLFIFRVIMEL